jgi:predicted nucleic-acid-binding protein
MRKLDANIVLRYVLNDHAELSPKAQVLIDGSACELPIEALSEVVYVLHGVYNTPRDVIRDKLTEFFVKTQTILPHREAVLKGLDYYGSTKLDFVDCILAGYAAEEGDVVNTFDKGLQKLLNKIADEKG